MKKLVALDDGHGLETAGKRTPPFPDSGLVILENEFNHVVKLRLIEVLKRCGVDYIDVSPERTDTPLSVRVKRANDAKADIFISIHYNALDGKWNTPKTGGIETYHYPGSINGEKLANLVHKYLIQGTVMPDRGVKTAKFYVLKYTHMPAVLVECGFMDVLSQAKLMLSEEYQWECAEEIGHGVCDYFGVEYKTSIVGTLILGSPQATVHQAKQWATERKAHKRFIDIADAYWDFGNITGIRPDVLYCQAAKETNFGMYTGQVKPEQNNWAGIKIQNPTGDKPQDHETFETQLDGVRAHFNHMCAYIGKEPHGTPHERYYVVKMLPWAGTIKTVEQLGGKWAPNPDYGKSIVRDYLKDLLDTVIETPPAQVIDYKQQVIDMINELKDFIKKYENGGV